MKPADPLEAISQVASPEIGLVPAVSKDGFTIFDWVRDVYQPPPAHPSTHRAFDNLGLEYIPSFEVDKEVPLFEIGRQTNGLRFELLFFQIFLFL